ncbi:MAG TPA: RNA-binding cell elongation regulator Jag/EloR [Candidatus Limnocylindria bacterium]|nr:RNA-binding cell elongation regulator Jag/EloR [Candidatus Limnocylindria bacterium]
MTFREFNGKNVEEAIRAAMREFEADLSELDIEILSQGSRGILGVGGEEARILAAPKSAIAAAETVRASEPPEVESPPSRRGRPARGRAAEQAPAPEPVPVEAPEAAEAAEVPSPEAITEADDQVAELERAERARGTRGGRTRGARGGRNGRGGDRRDRPAREPREAREREGREQREPLPFIPAKPMEELSERERAILEEAKSVLEEMLRLMEIEASVEVQLGSETAKLNVKGPDLGVLIGRRGEKLASLQHLVNLMAAKSQGQHNRIMVDVENYRGRREEQLRDVAERAAKRVSQSGKIIQLEPMPALERRIVHMALVENARVRTQSVGVEPNRRVVILPANKVGQS